MSASSRVGVLATERYRASCGSAWLRSRSVGRGQSKQSAVQVPFSLRAPSVRAFLGRLVEPCPLVCALSGHFEIRTPTILRRRFNRRVRLDAARLCAVGAYGGGPSLAQSQLDDWQLLDKIGRERSTRLDHFDQGLRNASADAETDEVHWCFLEFSCRSQGAVPKRPAKRGSGTRLDSRNDSKEASTFGYAKCDVIRAPGHSLFPVPCANRP